MKQCRQKCREKEVGLHKMQLLQRTRQRRKRKKGNLRNVETIVQLCLHLTRRCCVMAAHSGITRHVKWSKKRSMTFSVVPIVLTFTHYLESKVNILLFTEKVCNKTKIH